MVAAQPDEASRNELRDTLAALDERQKKIVGGVSAIMIENPDRVREREWIVEQFTQVVLLAGDFEDVSSVQEGHDRVQAYVRDNIDPLLNASYRLFQCVAQDLAGSGDEGMSRAQALAHAMGHLLGTTHE